MTSKRDREIERKRERKRESEERQIEEGREWGITDEELNDSMRHTQFTDALRTD